MLDANDELPKLTGEVIGDTPMTTGIVVEGSTMKVELEMVVIPPKEGGKMISRVLGGLTEDVSEGD